jgi:signal peptidase I
MVDRRTVALGGLQRGDVVAMVDPLDLETVRILRVAGIGGDRIELGPDGLLVNQAAAPRKELGPGTLEHQAQSGEWTSVATLRSETAIGERTFEILEAPDPAARRTKILSAGPDQLVLLGDNRLLAVDSFSFGPVERAALIGKAFLILGSKDPRTRQWRPERKGLPLP